VPRRKTANKQETPTGAWYNKRNYQLGIIMVFVAVVAVIMQIPAFYNDIQQSLAGKPLNAASIDVKVDLRLSGSFEINKTSIKPKVPQTPEWSPAFRNSITTFYVHVINNGTKTVRLKSITMNSNHSQVKPAVDLIDNTIPPDSYEVFPFSLDLTSWPIGAGQAHFEVAGDDVRGSYTLRLWVFEGP
jgi:hypothetical protein